MNKWTRRLGCAFLTVLGLSLGATIGFWFVLTRPFCGTNRPAGGPPLTDPARLRSHVEKLCTSFVPRDAAHPENLDRAADYIATRLAETGLEPERQIFQVQGLSYQNVLVRLGPAEGARIVIGAHYDAAGDQPGADDNASGVAGLLELARLLQAQPLSSPVELIAFTLEEPPHFRTQHMGSAVHARSLEDGRVQVRLMVSVEMIGCFSDEPGSQGFPSGFLKSLYPTKGNYIAAVGRWGQGRTVGRVKAALRRAGGIPAYAMCAPGGLPGIDLSDHRNYWDRGWPAVMVTDTAFFRNPRYHTSEDTPATLDYDRMARTVDALAAVVHEFAR